MRKGESNRFVRLLLLLTQKWPDLDFQALQRAVTATVLLKMAQNWLVLARNRMALATRATIVFATPISHTHS